MKKQLFILTTLLTLVLIIAGCSNDPAEENAQAKQPVAAESESEQSEPVEEEEEKETEQLEMKVGIAPGPATYPVAHMAETNDKLELKLWQGGEQLSSMITSKEVEMLSSPIIPALMSYNKGMDLQLMNISVWGMLYVMSTKDDVESLDDLKGKEIALAGKGSVHDLIFRHLLIQNDIDPDEDLTVTYLDMPEASAHLVSGEVDYAILNEPHSSIATMNAKKADIELNRTIDLTEEWNKLPGQEDIEFPMAGLFVINDTDATEEDYATFEEQYMESADWVNDNPEEAGEITEKHVEWMKAPAVANSLEFSRLNSQKAVEHKDEVHAFLEELSKTADLKAIGGKLPDDGFYYEAN